MQFLCRKAGLPEVASVYLLVAVETKSCWIPAFISSDSLGVTQFCKKHQWLSGWQMTCCMVTCGICRHQNNGVIFIMCILVCFSNAGGLVWILFICFPPQDIADLPINDLGAQKLGFKAQGSLASEWFLLPRCTSGACGAKGCLQVFRIAVKWEMWCVGRCFLLVCSVVRCFCLPTKNRDDKQLWRSLLQVQLTPGQEKNKLCWLKKLKEKNEQFCLHPNMKFQRALDQASSWCDWERRLGQPSPGKEFVASIIFIVSWYLLLILFHTVYRTREWAGIWK